VAIACEKKVLGPTRHSPEGVFELLADAAQIAGSLSARLHNRDSTLSGATPRVLVVVGADVVADALLERSFFSLLD
jgi:hypothetical protein